MLPMLAPGGVARPLHDVDPVRPQGLRLRLVPSPPVVAPAPALMAREDLPAWLLAEIDAERNRRSVRFWWVLTTLLLLGSAAGIVVGLPTAPELTVLVLSACTLMCARWNT